MKIEIAHGAALLPPPKDCCQVCAAKHQEKQPHNAQSLYYQVRFKVENGRSATWMDAMAHCTPEMKKKWWGALAKHGITKENGKVNP